MPFADVARAAAGLGQVLRVGYLVAGIGLASAGLLPAQTPVVAEFEVHAGEHERIDTPIAASLDGIAVQSQVLQLYEVTNGAAIFSVGSQQRSTRPWP